MPLPERRTYLTALAILFSSAISAQCLISYSWDFEPLLIDGNWGNEQSVNICLTISEEDWQGGGHYLHALIPTFGSGWDLSTLEVTPPESCSGDGGQWAWYEGPITSSASTLTHGAGFYYESGQGVVATDPNNPGDNFGDNCPENLALEFCFQISTIPYSDCLPSSDLNLSVNTLSDAESGGAFLSPVCDTDNDALFLAGLDCCDAQAGPDSTISFCSLDDEVTLNSYLQSTSSGEWYFQNISNPSLGSTFQFDPGIDPEGDYLFVVEGVAESCIDVATIHITVDQGYLPGSSSEVLICQSGSIVYLADLLGPDHSPGGTWTDPDNNSWTDPFIPAADSPGIYTYTIPTLGSCPTLSAELDVSIVPEADAGDNSSHSWCTCEGEQSLFNALQGSPQSGGVWTDSHGDTITDLINTDTIAAGIYTYSVENVNCSDQSQLDLEMIFVGEVGTGGSYTYCQETSELDLFDLLSGTFDLGGIWFGPDDLPLPTSVIDPSSAQSGDYRYRFNCSPCGDESILELTFIPTPTADIIGSVTQCTLDSFKLELDFSYPGPYELSIENAAGESFSFSGSEDGDLVTLGALGNDHFTIEMIDHPLLNGCSITTGPGTEITISDPPAALLSGYSQICPGQVVDLYPDIAGNGPFVLTISNSSTGVQFDSDPLLPGDSVRVYPNNSTTFEILSISDSSDSTCTSSGIGIYQVDIEDVPSASVSGGGLICGGDSAQAQIQIQGAWTDYDITLQASFGNIYLNNVQDGETIQFPVPNSLTYCLSEVNPAGSSSCQALLSDTCMDFEVLPNLITYGVSVECDQVTQMGTVHFFIQGGTGTYMVNGEAITGNEFTSPIMPNGSPFEFSVTDDQGCGPVVRSGILECECLNSRSGEFSEAGDTLGACIGEILIPIYDASNEILDPMDVRTFVIHDGEADLFGTPILMMNSIDGGISYSSELNPNEVYWLSAVIARDNGTGIIEPDDVCLEFSHGVGIVFHSIPTSTMNGEAAICAGEQASIPVSFTGNGPWNITLALNNSPFGDFSSSEELYEILSSQPGTYSVTSISDLNCQGIPEGSIEVSLQDLPSATISGGGDFCEGSGTGPLVQLEGEGPWNLNFSIDGIPDSVTLGNNPSVIPTTGSGTYSIHNISDSYCSQEVSGSVSVTMIPAPTVLIEVGTPTCEGDSVPVLIDFSGAGPFSYAYNFNGNNSDTLLTTHSEEGLYFSESGEFAIIYLFDGQCSAYQGFSDTVIIHPMPELSISLSSDTICAGQSLTVQVEPEVGIGPFGVDLYAENDVQTILVNNEGWSSIYDPENDMFIHLGLATDLGTGCADTITANALVEVTQYPLISLAPVLNACDGDTLLLGVPAEPGVSYEWTPSELALDPDSSWSRFIMDTESEDVLLWELELTGDRLGCRSTGAMDLYLHANPVSEFNYNPIPVTAINPLINLYSEGSGHNSYLWTLDSDTIAETANVAYNFPEDIANEYEICLEVIDFQSTCTSLHCELVEVLGEMSIYVPNSFSPNGDGINDLFGAVVKNADPGFFRFDIYDRAGLKVFSSDSPDNSWNGLDNNAGKRSRSGVYTYIIETRDKFGRNPERVEGFVVLIR